MKKRQTKPIRKPNLGMNKLGSRVNNLSIKNNIDSTSNVWKLSDSQLGQTNRKD